MSRIIKFRCYQGYNSHLKGWKGLKRVRKMFEWEQVSKWSMWEFTSSLKPNNADDRIMMQFTGVYDKNKIEIYEGDILGRETFDNWIVVWDNAGLKFYNSQRPSDKYELTRVDLDCHYREVIGNIYETPSLIKLK